MIKLVQEKTADGLLMVRGAEGTRAFTAAIKAISPGPRWAMSYVTRIGKAQQSKGKLSCDSRDQVIDRIAEMIAWTVMDPLTPMVMSGALAEVNKLGLKL